MAKLDPLLEAKKSKDHDLYLKLWDEALADMEKQAEIHLSEGMTYQGIVANNIAGLFYRLYHDGEGIHKERVLLAQELLEAFRQKHNVSVITKPEEITLGDIIHWKWKHKNKWYSNDIQVMDKKEDNVFVVRYTHHPLDQTWEKKLTAKDILCGYHAKLPRKPHIIFFFFHS